MSAVFTASELEHAAQGSWQGAILKSATFSLYTDSRVAGNGGCFVALVGAHFDAHNLLQAAIDSGAGALCIAKDKVDLVPPFCPIPFLVVEDTLMAYQAFANFNRRRYPNLPIVAVTGSVGKTSVKEMLRAIFTQVTGSEDAVLFTAGNTNNQVGVPQNLLRLNGEHLFGVLEFGTNSHGEIGPLSYCAEPQVGVVNSIAPCHLEKLVNLEGVAEEKSQIWSAISADGVAVFPKEVSAVEILEKSCRLTKQIRFGKNSEAEVFGTMVEDSLNGSTIALHFGDGSSHEISWQLSGEHQAQNAAAAAAAALAVGVSIEDIVKGLATTTLPGMRMAQSEIDGVIYINDAYNANPQSMAAAIAMLNSATGGGNQLILLLGDMLELGDFELKGHVDTLKLACEKLPLAQILTVGARMARGASAFNNNISCFGSASAVKSHLVTVEKEGDTVFLKGSRGMALEEALP